MTAMGYGDDTPDLNPMENSHPVQSYQDGDIRVEYHPNSHRKVDIFDFDKYHQSALETSSIVDPEPWAPFRTREDFEFAEIALETGMTKGQLEALIKLFRKCIAKEGSFTIRDHKDMKHTFDVASNRLAKVL
jgi:hypothetical protein